MSSDGHPKQQVLQVDEVNHYFHTMLPGRLSGHKLRSPHLVSDSLSKPVQTKTLDRSWHQKDISQSPGIVQVPS